MSNRLKLFDLLKKESASLFEGAHNVYTPKDLITEIVNNVDVSNKSILVVFNVEFVIGLIDIFNVDPGNITFYSDHENKSNLAKRFGVKYITDLETDMKFDVVIGNPPYQNKAENADGALWLQFVNKGLELVKEDGKLVFISPTSWVGKTSKTKKANFAPFTDNCIELYKPLSDDERKKFFPGVGSTFGYYVISRGHYSTTKLLLNDGTETNIVIKAGEPFPSCIDKTSMSIHKKLSAVSKFEFKSNFKMHSQRIKKSKVISDVSNTDFVYKTYYSHNLIRYASIKHELYDKFKVMIPIVGTLKNAWVDNDCNFTEDVRYLIVSDQEQGNNLINILNSKLFSYLGKTYRNGRNLGLVLQFLPKVDFNKAWTDSELYALFNLTAEEISYVESNS